jgi:rare lipoprotein A
MPIHVSLANFAPRRAHQRLLWLVLLGAFSLSAREGMAAVHALKGYASYYSPRFHGRCCTASGEAVNVYAMTAAHRTLPLGTVVRVLNLKNRRSVVVRINDRGPYGGGRVIDLSLAAFKALSSTDKGMIRVQLHVL